MVNLTMQKLINFKEGELTFDIGGLDMSESLFVGPKQDSMHFGPENPLWCPEPSRWNRKLYYSLPNPNLLEGDENLDALSKDDGFVVDRTGGLDDLSGKKGVWSVWGKAPGSNALECLDVHECLDLQYEMLFHEKLLKDVSNADWDDPMFEGPLFSMYKRTKAISNWCDLEYHVVVQAGADDKNMMKLTRELVEAQHAWYHKSVYWNRNYFQPVTNEQMKHQKQVPYIISRR